MPGRSARWPARTGSPDPCLALAGAAERDAGAVADEVALVAHLSRPQRQSAFIACGAAAGIERSPGGDQHPTPGVLRQCSSGGSRSGRVDPACTRGWLRDDEDSGQSPADASRPRVALAGFSSSVLTITRSTSSPLIDRGCLVVARRAGRPSHARRTGPATSPTVDALQPTAAAMSVLFATRRLGSCGLPTQITRGRRPRA